MEWAKTTELDDLNFMVPDDEEVKMLLQNFVQYQKFEVPSDVPVTPEERLYQFRCLVMQKGLSDVEVMEKFCKPKGFTYIDKLCSEDQPEPNNLIKKFKGF